jgi:predicted nucleic acid-binding protein
MNDVGRPDAVLDTCVLFPASVRGLLLNAASFGAFKPAWSEPILGELGSNLVHKRAMSEQGWQTLRAGMRGDFPSALVPQREIRRLEPSMPNDPKDRHVLAAAVASGAPVVVTNNLRDFQTADLQKVGVAPMHPDRYLSRLLRDSPEAMDKAITAQVKHMSRYGDWSRGQLLGHLSGLGHAKAMTPGFVAQTQQVLGIRPVAPPPRDRAPAALSHTAARSSPSRGLARAQSGRDARSI